MRWKRWKHWEVQNIVGYVGLKGQKTYTARKVKLRNKGNKGFSFQRSSQTIKSSNGFGMQYYV